MTSSGLGIFTLRHQHFEPQVIHKKNTKAKSGQVRDDVHLKNGCIQARALLAKGLMGAGGSGYPPGFSAKKTDGPLGVQGSGYAGFGRSPPKAYKNPWRRSRQRKI